MIDARQKSKFALFGSKLFVALLFVLCASVLCKDQTVASETCGFSKYKPLRISHFLKFALLEQVKPEYPPAAKAVGVHGMVRVKILVDRSGTVKQACVLEGHPLLQAVSIQAALDSRFKTDFGFSKSSRIRKTTFVTDELIYRFVKE